MPKVWQVQEAKARFSEMLDSSQDEGPQIVTKRGVEAAVLVRIDEWRRLRKLARRNVKDLLLAPEAPDRGPGTAPAQPSPSRAAPALTGGGPPAHRPKGVTDVPPRHQRRFRTPPAGAALLAHAVGSPRCRPTSFSCRPPPWANSRPGSRMCETGISAAPASWKSGSRPSWNRARSCRWMRSASGSVHGSSTAGRGAGRGSR